MPRERGRRLSVPDGAVSVASDQRSKAAARHISIETTINAPIELAWAAWIRADDIKEWNSASDNWSYPDAKIGFEVGG